MIIERVKILTDKDLDEIEGFSNEAYKKSKYLTVFSKETFREMWRRLFLMPTSVLFLLRKDGRVVGWMGGVIAPEIVNDLINAAEIGFRVGKEGKGGGKELLRCLVQWAREQGADRVLVHGWTDLDMESYRAWLEKFGFQHCGFQYALNLTGRCKSC